MKKDMFPLDIKDSREDLEKIVSKLERTQLGYVSLTTVINIAIKKFITEFNKTGKI